MPFTAHEYLIELYSDIWGQQCLQKVSPVSCPSNERWGPGLVWGNTGHNMSNVSTLHCIQYPAYQSPSDQEKLTGYGHHHQLCMNCMQKKNVFRIVYITKSCIYVSSQFVLFWFSLMFSVEREDNFPIIIFLSAPSPPLWVCYFNNGP